MTVSNILKQSNMSIGNVSVEYLILMYKVLIFEMRVSLLRFSLCKTNETFFKVSVKPWFIYRIKILYDRVLLFELA